MLDFIKWRGDLPFRVSPLGEVDALIFSQLAYLHFRDALGVGGMPVRAAEKQVEAIPYESGNAQVVADRHALLRLAAQSERYGHLTVAYCEDRFDVQREMQFAANAFTLPDGSHMLAFRGTDATLVGWRENFNMSFACPVPSQTEAVRYLEMVASQTAGVLRLCGHSKGGNLAMYAAACCTPAVRDRIADVYLFDAPGLNAATVETNGYRAMQPHVHCYKPQTSVIGMLMQVPQVYTVARSTATGIAQHNVFTWALDGPQLATLPELDHASRLIKDTLDDFLTDSTPAVRQLFVETLFTVLGAANTHTLGEMADNWTGAAGALWGAVRTVDPATRKAVYSVVSTLASSSVDSIMKRLGADREEPPKT